MQPIPLRTWIALAVVNIAISTVTTLLVLRVAGAPRQIVPLIPAPPPAAVQALQPASGTTPAVATAAQPTQVAKQPATALSSVRIVAVIGVGQRQREQVVIANEGDLADLKGWSVSSSRSSVYSFKNVAMLKDTFINLYTTSGSDTTSNVFWNRDEPAWQVGDTVLLKNALGQQVDAYDIK